MARPLTSMLRTLSFSSSSTIFQSINMGNKNELSDGKSGGNETNLSNPSASKRSTEAGYLTSKGAKKSGNKTKKGVQAVRASD